MLENVNITPIIEQIIALLVTIITIFVIPWVKSKTTEQQRKEMLQWVQIAVSAAQQLYHQANGSERKEYVLQFLSSKGYDISSKDIENAIEAEVLKLHQQLEADTND